MKKVHLYLLSVLSGVILSLGWPMHGFPFLLFLGFVPLLFIIDHLDEHHQKFHKYSIFQFSYLAFFIWNSLTTWWIWNSTIFGAVMAVLLNSLFMAIVFMVYHLSKQMFFKRSDAIYLLIFYWISFEFLHLDWDLSWPWLNLGNGFAMYTKWVQWYEYTGTFGGSLWVLLMNVLIYKIIKSHLVTTSGLRQVWLVSRALLIAIVPLLVSLIIYNNYQEKGEVAEVIVTQPNIDPWTEQYVLPPSKVIARNLSLADSLITPETDFVVCPESAIQEDIWHASIENSLSVRQIRKFIGKHPDINVIIGASTFRLFNEAEPLTSTARKFSDVEKYYEAFNTALFFNQNKEVGMYHKSKLVPGPEKMPFQRLLSPIQQIAFDLGGTVGSLGYSENRDVFSSFDGKFKAAPIICYESIYGDFVNGFVRNGANILCIVTNDGWWGNTAGHRQHFTFARLRALETRRSLARSANTGISAFIDQRGDVIESTGYWKPAVIKSKLKANDELTFYVVYGDFIGRISTFITIMVLLISISIALRKRRKQTRKF
ncbi:MAG: apolipoprotein N-acyltransferase [Bacteroidales bacterium]|nr:apolipoprotein N-acyltransferase [Bacteroidales bacterium]